MALHRYDRNLKDGTVTKCKEVKEKLKNDRDCYDDIIMENFKELLPNDSSILLDEDSGHNSIISWYNYIVDSEKNPSELCDETDYENIYYLPSFTLSLKKILAKLPLWSNLMLPFFFLICRRG